ncbi:MAG TPA: TetR/AcrR family transcriptional regulator [Vicinamibacterales bacterium]|nr:TetR/AcrR family transcriptional regulator [Vicinamibacterales bacterium]
MEPGDPTPPPVRRKRRRRRRLATAGRRSEISAATRIEILKSAAAAFRKLGYHGATVEQIAAALRMKKGNLYYYFKNKEEILFACHEYSHDRLQELLDEAVRSTAPAEAKLRRLITGAVHVILDELHGTALLLDLEALSPAHLKAVVHRRDRFDRGMRLIIEEGMATGAFAPGDPKLLGFAMLGALNWISRWFNPGGPSSSEDIATRFADYLIAGLRAT